MISKELREDLEELQLMLEDGTIEEKEFSMDIFCSLRDDVETETCETVGCIGGWLTWLQGYRAMDEETGKMEPALTSPTNEEGTWNLFMPSDEADASNGADFWNWIKPKHAVKAIQNLLDGERDPWLNVRA